MENFRVWVAVPGPRTVTRISVLASCGGLIEVGVAYANMLLKIKIFENSLCKFWILSWLEFAGILLEN